LKKKPSARGGKKLLLNWAMGVSAPPAQYNKSLFASFFSKKEVLARLSFPPNLLGGRFAP
jgi:hypothetical protein